MPVADLIRDARVVSPTLKGEERTTVIDFVRRRVRALIDATPALGDPGRPGDITAAATPVLATRLTTELPKVKAAHATIWGRVRTDPGHLALNPAVIRKRVSTRPPAKDARAMRKRLVRSIVYQAAARDITLAETANVERLHRICDRRLRITERMLYDVGRADHRSWSRTQINANKGGPWVDGLDRLFEYPRVPQHFFLGACSPDPSTGVCAVPMAEWHLRGSEHLIGPIRTNPGTTAAWRPNASDPANIDDYDLLYTTGHLPTAVAAIEGMFTPSPDYLKRNLLFCDHTIHALHLEALVFARRKRGAPTTWLDAEMATKPARWLRINVPFWDGERFLAGQAEPAHFEYLQVREADLQVGDHLIVYNHPAYDNATIAGVWRLENAVVVQTHPGLRMQGHGSRVYTKGGMWRTMVYLFNAELERRRADVEGLAAVRADGPNRVTVNSVRNLRVGMRIEIAHPVTDTVLASNRLITAINHSTRVVTYDGADVTATTAHVLRRPRFSVGAFEAISVDGIQMIRRVPAVASDYAGRHRRADWYLGWIADAEEDAIRLDPARAAFVKTHQLVEYTRETIEGVTPTLGWFPLWRPTLRGGSPIRSGGKIAATDPVVVAANHIAGWTWFFDPDPAKRDLVPVIRPRES